MDAKPKIDYKKRLAALRKRRQEKPPEDEMIPTPAMRAASYFNQCNESAPARMAVTALKKARLEA